MSGIGAIFRRDGAPVAREDHWPIGKSRLSCALGHKACREDLSVLYYRAPRLFAALALARGDGRYGKLLRRLARVNLLVLNDWDRSRCS